MSGTTFQNRNLHTPQSLHIHMEEQYLQMHSQFKCRITHSRCRNS